MGSQDSEAVALSLMESLFLIVVAENLGRD